MRRLLTTTAIAAAFGATAFGAQAQSTTATETMQQPAASPSTSDPAASSATASVPGTTPCSAFWGAVDTDENGLVTRQEATAVIGAEFDQIDADDNGEITNTEYVNCIAAHQTAAELRAQGDEESFAAADANQDQSLDADEFRTAAEQAYERMPNAESSQEVWRYVWMTPEEFQANRVGDMTQDEAAWRAAGTFQALDTNGDGRLDNMEWAQAQISPGPTEVSVNSRFEQLDADGSGSVNEQEYSTARNSMLDQIETGSVSTTGSASTDTTTEAEANASATAAQDGEQGIPIFVYRFLAL